MKNKAKIVQKKDEPIAAEIIATAIVEIADGIRKMNASRLNRKAIVGLIHLNSGCSKRQIEIVLNNLDDLESTWLKKR